MIEKNIDPNAQAHTTRLMAWRRCSAEMAVGLGSVWGMAGSLASMANLPAFELGAARVVRADMHAVLLALLAGLGSGVAPEVRTTLDVPYTDSGHPRHRLDVYAPVGADRAPVVVFFHGGGWRTGDKRQAIQGKERVLPAAGFVLVSANYRLAPEHRYPAFVEDAAAAVGWVHRNIGRYGGDPKRLFVMGHSAGAHLAACLGADPRWLGKHGLKPADLLGAIPLDGGGMRVSEAAQARSPILAGIYRQAFGDDPSVWDDASPLIQVRRAERPSDFLLVVAGRGLMGLPRADRRSREQAEEFAAAIRAKGARAEVSFWPDLDHGGANAMVGNPDHPLSKKVVAWMRERAQSAMRR
ncbi:MAG: alpha/beta hydrolase [Armatimonadetes bacterium]|nr:alpha/beta hydrolase [Armatimonadota bacterium]